MLRKRPEPLRTHLRPGGSQRETLKQVNDRAMMTRRPENFTTLAANAAQRVVRIIHGNTVFGLRAPIDLEVRDRSILGIPTWDCVADDPSDCLAVRGQSRSGNAVR
jgi:hypothetical protein